MAGISLIIDIRGDKDLLGGIRRKLQDLTPVMKDMGERMLLSVEENFRRGGRPPWPPSKKPEGQILIDTGRLKNSVTYRAEQDKVTVGSNVIYARIHQLGGMAGRGRTVKIPARPYLMVQDSDMKYLAKSIQEFLTRD